MTITWFFYPNLLVKLLYFIILIYLLEKEFFGLLLILLESKMNLEILTINDLVIIVYTFAFGLKQLNLVK